MILYFKNYKETEAQTDVDTASEERWGQNTALHCLHLVLSGTHNAVKTAPSNFPVLLEGDFRLLVCSKKGN